MRPALIKKRGGVFRLFKPRNQWLPGPDSGFVAQNLQACSLATKISSPVMGFFGDFLGDFGGFSSPVMDFI